MALPRITNDAELDALVKDEVAIAGILDHLARELDLPGLTAPLRGSAIVGMTETEVIKVMAPHDRALNAVETACLQGLAGRLPVATPELREVGEIDGWPFIRMTRLPGAELKERWGGLSAVERLSLATQLGECLAAMHGLEAPGGVPRLNWEGWCASLGPPRNVPEEWSRPLDRLLRVPLAPSRPAWLHTEVMLEHLLVLDTPDGPRLSGLFDFEPSWVAPVEYELPSVALFVSAGERAVLREVMRSAGLSVSAERLFGFAMKHRYANLGWWRTRLGGPAELPDWVEWVFGS